MSEAVAQNQHKLLLARVRPGSSAIRAEGARDVDQPVIDGWLVTRPEHSVTPPRRLSGKACVDLS